MRRHAPRIRERLLVLLLAVSVSCIVALQTVSKYEFPDRNLVDKTLEGQARADAVSALTAQQRAKLLQREKLRLLQEPLDITALDNLGVLRSIENDSTSADSFMIEGAKRSYRNLTSQLWALRKFLVANNYVDAFFHFDVVLTTQPSLSAELYPTALVTLGRQDARASLANVLKRAPPWRFDFFDWLIKNDKSDQFALQMFHELRKSGGQETKFELLEYLRKLIASKHFEQAYFVWLDSLNANELTKVGYIYDGGFDMEAKGLYFDWTVYPINNSEVGIVQKMSDSPNRMLRLSFFNSDQMFSNVWQILRLQPGNYDFEGAVATKSLHASGGIKLTIVCIEKGNTLGDSEVFREVTPWRDFSFQFTVPESDCKFQQLFIHSASPALLDAKMDGELMFDDFSIKVVSKRMN